MRAPAAIQCADFGLGALDRRQIVRRNAALRLQRGRRELVDVAERRCRRLSRCDGGRQRFLRGDPAFALGAARRRGEALGLAGGAIEGHIAAPRLLDQR